MRRAASAGVALMLAACGNDTTAPSRVVAGDAITVESSGVRLVLTKQR